MFYKKIPPPPALQDIVQFFWILEGDASNTTPLLYRLFADACPGLIVQYGNRFSDCTPAGLRPVPGCFFQGPSRSYSETTVTGAFGLIGVYFYPSAARLLTGIPACELAGVALDAHLLLGPTGDIEERIHAAATLQERIAVLSAFLLGRLQRTHRRREHAIERCIRHLLRVRIGLPVETMALDAGLSVRQFERKFAGEAGLPPKLFSRIVRFQNTLLTGGGARKLTELAYTGGYSDQAHFIREFREFSGMNPRQYFSHIDEAAESLIQIRD